MLWRTEDRLEPLERIAPWMQHASNPLHLYCRLVNIRAWQTRLYGRKPQL